MYLVDQTCNLGTLTISNIRKLHGQLTEQIPFYETPLLPVSKLLYFHGGDINFLVEQGSSYIGQVEENLRLIEENEKLLGKYCQPGNCVSSLRRSLMMTIRRDTLNVLN
jgi:hypothetical protein